MACFVETQGIRPFHVYQDDNFLRKNRKMQNGEKPRKGGGEVKKREERRWCCKSRSFTGICVWLAETRLVVIAVCPLSANENASNTIP